MQAVDDNDGTFQLFPNLGRGDSGSMNELDEDIIQEFVGESREHLVDIDEKILALESSEDPGAIDQLFRSVHSVKGSCGFLGLGNVETLAHRMEDVLSAVRDGNLAISSAIVDILLAGGDRLRGMLDAADLGADTDVTELVSQLQAILTDLTDAEIPAAPDDPSGCPETGASARAATGPLLIDSVVTHSPPTPVEFKPSNGRGEIPTVRVRIDLLDQLMDTVGEIVLARNHLLQEIGNVGRMPRLSFHVSELQERVMQTRLQPVDGLFARFRRMARDLGRTLGKRIRVEITGRSVELDRSIVEALIDPLTHIVRNAADHGLEPADERLAAGKPAEGTIWLRALHRGGQITIEIEDDGRGINVDTVRRKAVEKGLIQQDEAAQLSQREALNLVFLPGFSTAAAVTQVSGRGVGMDVVRTAFEKLGGAVELDSTAGHGSRVTIRLPLTLAIIPSVIVAVADRRFAIPQAVVKEVLRIGTARGGHGIEQLEGGLVTRLRQTLLPLVRLRDLVHTPRSDTSGPPSERAVVLRVGTQLYGLVVDHVLDTEEIVVKQLPSLVQAAQLYSGATILGGGALALILDVTAVASAAGCRPTDEYIADTTPEAVGNMERTELLRFEVTSGELFAVPLAAVARIDVITADELQRFGSREFYETQCQSVELVDLSTLLAISTEQAAPKRLLGIEIKAGRRLALAAARVVDVAREVVAVEGQHLQRNGILGSALIGGRMTALLNLAELTAVVDAAVDLQQADEVTSISRILLYHRPGAERVLPPASFEGQVTVTEVDATQDTEQAVAEIDQHDAIVAWECDAKFLHRLAQQVRSHPTASRPPLVAVLPITDPAAHFSAYRCGVDAIEASGDPAAVLQAVRRARTAQKPESVDNAPVAPAMPASHEAELAQAAADRQSTRLGPEATE